MTFPGGVFETRRANIEGIPLRAAVIALAAVWIAADARAQAPDISKYPNITAQWERRESPQFDPNKPRLLGQQIPYTPEYQKLYEEILADRRTGGLANDPTAWCVPYGMPRIMINYDATDVVVTPAMTFLHTSSFGETRRVYTDGRAWPEKIEPTYTGYSIGQWIDEDHDGKFDVLEIETRGFRGPRTYNGDGAPMHTDNQTIVKERVYLDKTDPNVLHDDITVTDDALTGPWTVLHKYVRAAEPQWTENFCLDNVLVLVGKSYYFVGAGGHLMPAIKDQPPPDLRHFKEPEKK